MILYFKHFFNSKTTASSAIPRFIAGNKPRAFFSFLYANLLIAVPGAMSVPEDTILMKIYLVLSSFCNIFSLRRSFKFCFDLTLVHIAISLFYKHLACETFNVYSVYKIANFIFFIK